MGLEITRKLVRLFELVNNKNEAQDLLGVTRMTVASSPSSLPLPWVPTMRRMDPHPQSDNAA